MSEPKVKRRLPVRTALLAIGGLGLAAGLGGTMAQWSDTAVIQGDIETGEFSITVSPDELDFDEFVPDVAQVGSHTLTNEGSVDAHVTLDIDGFPSGGPNATDWELLIETDTAPTGFGTRYEGDPSGGASGIELGVGPYPDVDALILGPGESVEVQITLELDVDDNDGQDIELDDVTFTFTGVQPVD